MARLFWSPPSVAAGTQISSLNPEQAPVRQEAVLIDPSDFVYPAPGGGLLRVPPGGGVAAQMLGTLPGQLIYYDQVAGRWTPTPTQPADGDIARWNAAANAWQFATAGLSNLQYFDTTFNPVGLWNFNGSLLDTSGNGNNLTLAAGNPGFADVVPGKLGLFVWVGCRYATAAAVPALQLAGDMTAEAIIQQDVNPIASNQVVCAYGGPGETQPDNTMYTLNLQATAAFTTTRNLQFDSETGAGVNNTYSSSGTSASLGCIHNIVHLAVTRISNVVQFYVNGRPFSNASSAFPAPDGGGGANARFTVGSSVSGTAVDQLLLFGVKLIGRGLSAAEVKSEYNRTMGPAFGVIS